MSFGYKSATSLSSTSPAVTINDIAPSNFYKSSTLGKIEMNSSKVVINLALLITLNSIALTTNKNLTEVNSVKSL